MKGAHIPWWDYTQVNPESYQMSIIICMYAKTIYFLRGVLN